MAFRGRRSRGDRPKAAPRESPQWRPVAPKVLTAPVAADGDNVAHSNTIAPVIATAVAMPMPVGLAKRAPSAQPVTEALLIGSGPILDQSPLDSKTAVLGSTSSERPHLEEAEVTEVPGCHTAVDTTVEGSNGSCSDGEGSCDGGEILKLWRCRDVPWP